MLTWNNIKTGAKVNYGTESIWTPGRMREIATAIASNADSSDTKTNAYFKVITNDMLASTVRLFGKLPAFGGNAAVFMEWLNEKASSENPYIEFETSDDIALGGVNAKDVQAFLDINYSYSRSKWWSPSRGGGKCTGLQPAENRLYNFTVPIPAYGWKLGQGISYETWRSNTNASDPASLVYLDFLLGRGLASTEIVEGELSFTKLRGISSITKEEITNLVAGIDIKDLILRMQKEIYVPYSKISYWYLAKQSSASNYAAEEAPIIEFYNSLSHPARARFLSGGFFYYNSVCDFSLGKFTNWDDPGKKSLGDAGLAMRNANLPSGLSFMRRGQ